MRFVFGDRSGRGGVEREVDEAEGVELRRIGSGMMTIRESAPISKCELNA